MAELLWSLYDSSGRLRTEITENEIGGILSTNMQEGHPVYFLCEDEGQDYRIEISAE